MAPACLVSSGWGGVPIVDAIGGGAIIDDTDCIPPVDHWIAAASVNVGRGASFLEPFAATRMVCLGFVGQPRVTAELRV